MATLSAVLLTSMGVLLGAGERIAEATPAAEPQVEKSDVDYLCLENARYIYYSDSTYTTAVGEEYCECRRLAVRTGLRTPYVDVLYAEPCDFVTQDAASSDE
ncbi:hypothetical protein ACLEPN_11320 [Myxococcus sp. 1LA]